MSRLEWAGESDRTVEDIRRDAKSSPDERSERDDVAEWLIGYLDERGGSAPYADVLKAAQDNGIALSTLKRARLRSGVQAKRQG